MRQHPEVVVLGGGVVGCAVAYRLAREGVRVLVLEREALGSQASGVAAGLLTPLAESEVPGPLLHLALGGLKLHRSLSQELREEQGSDVHYAEIPVLRPAFTPEEEQSLKAQLDWQRGTALRPALREPQGSAQGTGLRVEWVGAGEARRLEPRLSQEARGALLSLAEAQVESYRLVVALAQAAEARGVELRYATVTGLESQGQRVTGVVHHRGKESCSAVVLALGPWTAQVGQWLGVPIPVEPLRGQLLQVEVPDPPLRTALFQRLSYVLPKPSGYTIMGTTEERVGFDPQPTSEGREAILRGVLHLAPSLAEARVTHAIAGLRPVSPDGLPIIGPVPGWEGVFIATGHGRKGVLLGPITGRIIADLILGWEPPLPVEPFSLARFG